MLVDAASVGSVPLKEPLLLEIGPHTLRVEQAGYEPYETALDVPGNTDIAVSIALKPVAAQAALPARLSIVSSGERDIVSIDNKVVGSHQWQGTVAVGAHVVRVTAPGKKTYEADVELAPGSTRSLQVSLENEAHGSPVWIWVAGGAAVAAGAVVGGYFAFKPQDKPGSHPEGSISTVYLPLKGWGR